MTHDQLRALYRQRQMRPVRSEYYPKGMSTSLNSGKQTGSSVRMVKPLSQNAAGCCGRRSLH